MHTPKARLRHYIGIDPSLRGTGIALLSVEETEVTRRTLRIGLPDDGPVLLYLQCNAFLEFVGETVGYNLCSISGICIEGGSFGSTRRADSAGQIRGAYLLCCIQNFGLNVIPREVPPTSLKKFFAGTGTASKERMIAAAESCNWTVESDDEADAAGLAELAWAMHDETLPITRKQLEAIKGIRDMDQPSGRSFAHNKSLNI